MHFHRDLSMSNSVEKFADSTVNPPERWVIVCTTLGAKRYSAMQHQLQASYSEILEDIVFIVFFIKWNGYC